MVDFLIKFLLVVRSRLKSRARLEAEILLLRQEVTVLSRKSRSRVWLRNIDRLIFVWMYRLFPSILDAITVVKPETVIRWHRRGFRAYWSWKSCVWRITDFPRISNSPHTRRPNSGTKLREENKPSLPIERAL
jgi:hypothetical protein